MKKYYRTIEISNLLGVTSATVNTWINSGELLSYKTIGGHNRINGDVFFEFLIKNKIPIPSEFDMYNRPKLLIVEDEPDIVKFILMVIKKTEYLVETDVAKDGYMAGNKVVTFKPDIVILDIMLPGIDGFEICRRIREQLSDRTKVLAVTANPSEEYKRRILEAGADLFMKKPMLVDELRKIIDKFISSFAGKYSLIKRTAGNSG